MRRSRLLVIPTGGITSEGGLTEAGAARIERAAEIAFAYDAVAIIGGFRISGPTEADAYLREAKKYPSLSKKVVIVDASSFCTNRDLADAMPLIKGFFQKEDVRLGRTKIGIVSYEEHARRAAIVFGKHGFRNIEIEDSGENRAYWLIVEWLMLLLTIFDPAWKSPLGRLLVWMAKKRIG